MDVIISPVNTDKSLTIGSLRTGLSYNEMKQFLKDIVKFRRNNW